MGFLYPAIYRRVLHPVYHALKRDGFNAVEREALATDELDATGMARLQRAKFSRLLREARTRSPYYRQVIDAGTPDAALDGTAPHALGLPVLTKQIIRERVDDLVASGVARNQLVGAVADGSESESVGVYTDLHVKRWRQAVAIRNRRWLGVPIGERAAVLWGAAVGSRKSNSVVGRLRALLARSCVLDASDLSEARMAGYLMRLRAFGPRLLIGYPSVLVRFGKWCAAEGEHIQGLRAIVTTAESLYHEQRARIAGTLRAPVYDRYGCREIGCIAHERPGTDGLLVNADRVLVELLDGQGQPVPAGERGSVHVTDLDNFSMPMIRYDVGDFAVKGPSSDTHPYSTLAQVGSRMP